ncbi:MAG: heme ABC transporter substrate-binding protein IsdE [Coprobacillaceae bacterium]
MKKITIIGILLITLLTGCVNQNQKVQSEEERIVTTSVAIAEILDALEVENVVGVPESETYTLPSRYEKVKTVGAPMNPDMEVISTLDVSLILSPNSLEGDLATKYENAKIDCGFVNLKSTVGMFKSIEELGTLLNKEKQANALVAEFKTYMEEYQNKHEGKQAPTVLILMGLPGSYVVATENSYVGSLVKLAGAQNVYGDENSEDFLNVNPEDMLEKNPDIILRTSHALPEQVEEMFAKEFAENDTWQHFEAVKNEKVYDLDYNKFGMSANFKYQEALIDLEGIFYP